MLDLSFRSLGRSELRLHAYPIMRDVLRTPHRGFIAIPSSGGSDLSLEHGPGRSGHAHGLRQGDAGSLRRCIFTPRQATRRLSCLRWSAPAGLRRPKRRSCGSARRRSSRMRCSACSDLRAGHDYTGREVARVSACSVTARRSPILTDHTRRLGSRAPDFDAARLSAGRVPTVPEAGSCGWSRLRRCGARRSRFSGGFNGLHHH